ncbi:MAG: DUF421 domain-containing protein [Ruminococcus sp.]|nr:DUF421 domain-containing protein [Ruminococcus sp.]
MDFWRVFLVAPLSIIVLFILSKLIGNKQIANLNIFDYINGITIGSIAAEMATCEFDELADCTLALVIYAVMVFGLSVLSQKSLKMRRFFTGKTIVIFDRGKLYKKNLNTAKLDFNEFIAMLRTKGYFNLDEIETAFLEQNGQLSVLPKDKKRPLTPDDMKIRVLQSRPEKVVIMDGHILTKNLNETGNNTEWLEKMLKSQNKKLSEVFVAFCDGDNNLKIVECSDKNPSNDSFE